MRQLTLWKPVDQIIYSEYGRVTYKEWVEKELERLSEGEKKNTYFIKTKKEAGLTLISIWTTKKALKIDYQKMLKSPTPYLNVMPRKYKKRGDNGKTIPNNTDNP